MAWMTVPEDRFDVTFELPIDPEVVKRQLGSGR
jgi:hypothetical protein